MSAQSRPVITLKPRTPKEPGEEKEIFVDVIDVLLPCRRFVVFHKVAEVGAVSLVTEFMLRLVHTMAEIDEKWVAEYFGFNEREMSVALAELDAKSYMRRANGNISLTAAGEALFQNGGGLPQIYSVQARNLRQGFDLISFAPQEWVRLDRFDSKLDELRIGDASRVANASREIGRSFKRHFGEIAARVDRDVGKNVSIYSIDSVTAESRFLVPVRVYLKASISKPSAAEPDLGAWRPPQEVEDRQRVVESVSEYVESLKGPAKPDVGDGYELLKQIGGEFLSDFVRKDGVAVERYFSVAVNRVGEFRADRKTVPVVGSLFLDQNAVRLSEAIRYGLSNVSGSDLPAGLFWLVPEGCWGYTTRLPATVGAVEEQVMAGSEGVFKAIAVSKGGLRPHLREVFSNALICPSAASISSCVEVLWIPKVVAGVFVHAPIRANAGIPVPLGFLSFDNEVLDRAERFLLGAVPNLADHLARTGGAGEGDESQESGGPAS